MKKQCPTLEINTLHNITANSSAQPEAKKGTQTHNTFHFKSVLCCSHFTRLHADSPLSLYSLQAPPSFHSHLTTICSLLFIHLPSLSFHFSTYHHLHCMYETMSTTVTASRRPKWHNPPPPPTPRILHFPRRPRRRPATVKVPAARPHTSGDTALKATLETLFDRDERACAPHSVPIVVFGGESERRRERVERSESVVVEEEKWKFQAEMLRAECNLLRMEKEIAVKKLERTRSKMERTLRSALHTLVSVSPSFFSFPSSLILLLQFFFISSYLTDVSKLSSEQCLI